VRRGNDVGLVRRALGAAGGDDRVIPMNSSDRPWQLVVADLDGTLITGTSAASHLDEWIGHGPAVKELQSRFLSGQISNAEVAAQYAPLYQGIALADARAALASVPCLDDIAVGVDALHLRGIEAVIATASWSFAAQALADQWGFDAVRGVDLEVDAATGTFTGRISRDCEPEDKIAFVTERCADLGVRLEQVVAIGDGRSDLPLFGQVGFSVAINATPEVQAAASVNVSGRSFLDALRVVPGLLA
jgi:phosphoserine phosphatase